MTDIRSIRTKEKLRVSLETLLKSVQYEKISISDIAEGAKINRVTFYTHYQDKDELLKDVIDSFATKYSNNMRRSLEERKDEYEPPEKIFLSNIIPFIDYCLQNQDFVKNLSKAKDGMVIAYFGKAISNAIYPITQKYSKRKISHAFSFSSAFVVAGYIDIVLSWISNPVISKEEFYSEIKDFTIKLVRSEIIYSYD